MEHVIFNTLKLARDFGFIFFSKYVQKDKDNASLTKLRSGVEKEESAVILLKSITEMARQQGMNIEEVFH